jgi:hypothetical protein
MIYDNDEGCDGGGFALSSVPSTARVADNINGPINNNIINCRISSNTML